MKKSWDEGYPTGIGSAAGSLLVAFLCGITEINPLSKELGRYQLPPEVFMGLQLDKEPIIWSKVASNIKKELQECIDKIPGVGDICRAGRYCDNRI